jgi:plasmid stabilization system protein ParE
MAGASGIKLQHYKVRRAAAVTKDLDLIEDHLVTSYQQFGEDLETAIAHAAARINDALLYMRTFITQPHRSTEQTKIRPGIRTVTNKKFIFYFEINDTSSEVSILAIFFGGMDHRQQIMDRLRN